MCCCIFEMCSSSAIFKSRFRATPSKINETYLNIAELMRDGLMCAVSNFSGNITKRDFEKCVVGLFATNEFFGALVRDVDEF